MLNENGIAVYTSDSVDGSDTANFSDLSIIMSNPGYTIQIWDSDTITQDDLLGEYSISDLMEGNFGFNDGGTQGTVFIELQVNSQFSDSQEITVFDVPDGNFGCVYLPSCSKRGLKHEYHFAQAHRTLYH